MGRPVGPRCNSWLGCRQWPMACSGDLKENLLSPCDASHKQQNFSFGSALPMFLQLAFWLQARRFSTSTIRGIGGVLPEVLQKGACILQSAHSDITCGEAAWGKLAQQPAARVDHPYSARGAAKKSTLLCKHHCSWPLLHSPKGPMNHIYNNIANIWVDKNTQ